MENRKNIVVGTVLEVTEPYFSGSFRKPTYLGDRKWKGIITADTYGCDHKHRFTIQCTESSHESIIVRKSYRRQGKNLYHNCYIVSQPKDVDKKTEIKNIRKKQHQIYA